MTCSAIILAGGQGQRMNGADKGLVLWQEQPLIQHVITALRPQVENIIISCNRHIEEYNAFGYPCIKDESNTFLGPLAGIASCIGLTNHSHILLCPCDTPLIPANLVQDLEEKMSQSQVDVTIVNDGNTKHYCHALLTSHFAKTARIQLHSQQKSLRAWYDTSTWNSADFSGQAKAFTNINTVEQLAIT